jgi:hypothetical protein
LIDGIGLSSWIPAKPKLRGFLPDGGPQKRKRSCRKRLSLFNPSSAIAFIGAAALKLAWLPTTCKSNSAWLLVSERLASLKTLSARFLPLRSQCCVDGASRVIY